MLFVSDPILSHAERFAEAAHDHFAAVRTELVRTDFEQTAKFTLCLSQPPCPHGTLEVLIGGDAAQSANLIHGRELDEAGVNPWLPEHVKLALEVTWTAPVQLSDSADPDRLLEVVAGVQRSGFGDAWVDVSERRSTRALVLRDAGSDILGPFTGEPSRFVSAGIVDELSLPQAHGRDWDGFAGQLAALCVELAGAAGE